MKLKKMISAVFGLIAACTCVLAVCLAFHSLDAEPVLLTPPEEANARITALMEAVCDADYDRISQHLYGTPSLGIDREPSDEVGCLIWTAFTESLSYELIGQCCATNDGLSQTVRLTSLDISTVTATLKDRSQALLEDRVANAADISEIYDENNEYREDFVMGVLYDAAAEALAEDARTQTLEFTLNLVYTDGQWWIISNSEILDAISAGVLY